MHCDLWSISLRDKAESQLWTPKWNILGGLNGMWCNTACVASCLSPNLNLHSKARFSAPLRALITSPGAPISSARIRSRRLKIARTTTIKRQADRLSTQPNRRIKRKSSSGLYRLTSLIHAQLLVGWFVLHLLGPKAPMSVSSFDSWRVPPMATTATEQALLDTLDSGRVSYENHRGVSPGQVQCFGNQTTRRWHLAWIFIVNAEEF